MTNYIEIQHRYTDADGDLNIDTRWAVSPTPHEWTHADGTRGDWSHIVGGSWQIEPGNPINIYDQSDIDGLRKLLDAIEERLKNEKESDG